MWRKKKGTGVKNKKKIRKQKKQARIIWQKKKSGKTQ